MSALAEKAQEALRQINQVILGKEPVVEEIFVALLAGGHVLLEDIPGVGKTTLALAFSKTLELDFGRVQFTPDVMPSDLTGFSVYQSKEETFVYQPGTVFCNLFLADEINRTSPKTQSALLEVMEEGRVSVDGVTREVPEPFFVIATQNPAGSTGTQLLPEAQMDRFMISAALGYPDFEHELRMAQEAGKESRISHLMSVVKREQLLEMQKETMEVYMKETVSSYLLKLITATREHPYLARGASPRGTIALVKAAKAYAWLCGRSYVIPSDVETQFPYIVGHRILQNGMARMEHISVEQTIHEIISAVKKPSLDGSFE